MSGNPQAFPPGRHEDISLLESFGDGRRIRDSDHGNAGAMFAGARGSYGDAGPVQLPVKVLGEQLYSSLDLPTPDFPEHPQSAAQREDSGERRMTGLQRGGSPAEIQPLFDQIIRHPRAAPTNSRQVGVLENRASDIQRSDPVAGGHPFVSAEGKNIDLVAPDIDGERAGSLGGVDNEPQPA